MPLPLRAVGFRMLPYALAGQTRGELLHFLGAQDPMENDVPCTLRLGRQRTVSIPEVWEELAAPTLRRCIPRHAPILLDRLTEAALDCPAFARTLRDCFQGESPCWPWPMKPWPQADSAAGGHVPPGPALGRSRPGGAVCSAGGGDYPAAVTHPWEEAGKKKFFAKNA